MHDHDDSQFDYAWVIPRQRWLHALYHYAERHPWSYSLTRPLWWARYHWRFWQAGRQGGTEVQGHFQPRA